MNILPKKNWHVRNRDNIARVKADEAKAAEKERKEQQRLLLAEQEARTNYLRGKRKHALEAGSSTEALQLFRDVEEGRNVTASNKEYEDEKKKEKETYEKSIGLLTYLGQSVTEGAGKPPWWMEKPSRSSTKPTEIEEEWEKKKKQKMDPLMIMRKAEEEINRKRADKSRSVVPTVVDPSKLPFRLPDDIRLPQMPVSGSRPSTSSSLMPSEKALSHSSASKSMDQLRAERLQRERLERQREMELLAKHHCPQSLSRVRDTEPEEVVDERSLPYNAAFNPDISAAMAERRHNNRTRKYY